MTDMKLIIPIESYRQMMAYVELAKGEITWFFDVNYDEVENSFVVGKIYLLPQEASGALVEMDEPEVAKFLLQLMDQDIEQLPRGWGHSHVNMAAFFSGTDDNTIDQLDTGSFLVALVMNKRQEYEAVVRFDYPDFKQKFDLKLVINYQQQEIPEEYRLEVEEKVKQMKPFNWKKWNKKGKQKNYDKGHWVFEDGVWSRSKLPFDDQDAADLLDDDSRLDPVIQEQLKLQAPKMDHIRPAKNLICANCWIYQDVHATSAKACGKPRYMSFQDAWAQRPEARHD